MGNKKPPRASSMRIEIVEEVFVTLPKEENDERIERLTRKILRILHELENPSKRSRRHSDEGAAPAEEALESLLGAGFEKRLGI